MSKIDSRKCAIVENELPILDIARNTSPGLIRHQPIMSSITSRLVMFSLRITKTISTNEKMNKRIYVLLIVSNESCEALQLIPKNLRLLFSAKFVFSIEQISRSKIFFKLLPAPAHALIHHPQLLFCIFSIIFPSVLCAHKPARETGIYSIETRRSPLL
jgi:hypothetical protein